MISTRQDEETNGFAHDYTPVIVKKKAKIQIEQKMNTLGERAEKGDNYSVYVIRQKKMCFGFLDKIEFSNHDDRKVNMV